MLVKLWVLLEEREIFPGDWGRPQSSDSIEENLGQIPAQSSTNYGNVFYYVTSFDLKYVIKNGDNNTYLEMLK
jgi:hypothetical protein